MKRDFKAWFSCFHDNIYDYKLYVDFAKVYKNVDSMKVELNIMNSLIGSKTIEKDFVQIMTKYPETLKCIPILLAVRAKEISVLDVDGEYNYDFSKMNYSMGQYKTFMRETGLFDLMANHLINSLVDYVTGVETGLDSNGRKNRCGHQMENLVEDFIRKAGYIKDQNYFKEMYIRDVEKNWDINLAAISNQGKAEKRFDFVIKTERTVYGIETNFYSGGGSKLNETARSYKTLALESKEIEGFRFVWITDGKGWRKAKHNLEETFDVLDAIYNIHDLESGVLESL